MMDNNQLIFRQGDVILKRVNKFNEKMLEKTESKTIALGEATGHHHSFRGSDQVLVYKDPISNDPKMVKVAEGQTAILEHQEHLPLQIPEGAYEKAIQVEYNPFLENMTRVVD